MLRSRINSTLLQTQPGLRFMRTVPLASTNTSNGAYKGLKNGLKNTDLEVTPDFVGGQRWAKHSIGTPQVARWEKHTLGNSKLPERSIQEATGKIPESPKKRTRLSRLRRPKTDSKPEIVDLRSNTNTQEIQAESQVQTEAQAQAESQGQIEAQVSVAKESQNEAQQEAQAKKEDSQSGKVVGEKKKRRVLRPRKALITLTPKAVSNLRTLLDQPEPQLIRIGVQNRGCSGLTYQLDYVTQPGKFDEVVEQDGVKVFIDSKALFSIVGSEMDWIDDKLSQRFIFRNPNSKGTCGCGESFMV